MADTPVSRKFEDLVRNGHVRPIGTEPPREFPGAHRYIPSIVGYVTPEAPIRPEAEYNAKLGQRAEGDNQPTSNAR